jgi:hypothetical protein
MVVRDISGAQVSHVVSSLVIFSVWAFPSSHFKLPLSPLKYSMFDGPF